MREDPKKIPSNAQAKRLDPEVGIGFVIQRMIEFCKSDTRVEKCWVDEVDKCNHIAVLTREQFYAETLVNELDCLSRQWSDKLNLVNYFRVYLPTQQENLINFIPSGNEALIDIGTD